MAGGLSNPWQPPSIYQHSGTDWTNWRSFSSLQWNPFPPGVWICQTDIRKTLGSKGTTKDWQDTHIHMRTPRGPPRNTSSFCIWHMFLWQSTVLSISASTSKQLWLIIDMLLIKGNEGTFHVAYIDRHWIQGLTHGQYLAHMGLYTGRQTNARRLIRCRCNLNIILCSLTYNPWKPQNNCP